MNDLTAETQRRRDSVLFSLRLGASAVKDPQ